MMLTVLGVQRKALSSIQCSNGRCGRKSRGHSISFCRADNSRFNGFLV